MQYAADIAACRNGQQISAKVIQRRWKHEVQMAFFRRRSAMTRAVLPNILAVEEWFLADFRDRALSHWVRAPSLDGRDDDDDADTGTDTATPDDDSEDIVSLSIQQSTFLQLSNFWSLLACSSKTTAYVLASSPNPSPSSGCSMSRGPWLSQHLQPYGAREGPLLV